MCKQGSSAAPPRQSQSGLFATYKAPPRMTRRDLIGHYYLAGALIGARTTRQASLVLSTASGRNLRADNPLLQNRLVMDAEAVQVFGGLAELADAQDLGSCVQKTCGFKSLSPHQPSLMILA